MRLLQLYFQIMNNTYAVQNHLT